MDGHYLEYYWNLNIRNSFALTGSEQLRNSFFMY
jgi:hypothetical protein